MRLSTSLNVLCDHNNCLKAEHAIECLSQIGFKVLDFNFCDWVFEGSPFVDDTSWEKWIDKINNHAQKNDISFSQGHAPIFNFFDYSLETNLMTKFCQRSILGASRLGIEWLVFHTESSRGAFDKEHLDFVMRKNKEWFSNLIPMAESANVGIAIENTTDVFGHDRESKRLYGSTTDELIELADSFNHPLIGICWDTGHAELQKLDQPKAILSMGNRLKALHIQDNNGLEDQHFLPYMGKVKWDGIIKALKEINYRGDFTYEVHNFTKSIPNALKESALRYAFELGCYFVDMFCKAEI